MEARQEHSISSMEQLKKMRVLTRKADSFIWFQGMLAWEKEKQMSFLPQLDDIVPQMPSLARVLG